MTDVHSRVRACIVFATLLAATVPASAQVPITAVPPADYRGRPVAKAAPAEMTLPRAAPALRIALPEPTAAERASLKTRNATKAASGRQSHRLEGSAGARVSA